MNYLKYRDQIKDGDVLMYKGTGLTSWIIKKVTGSKYSHASIVCWWNGRLMVLEAIGKGVISSPLSVNIKKYHGEIEWFTYKGEIPNADRKEMVEFAQLELGKEYPSPWKFLKFLGDPDRSDKFKKNTIIFCSQFVARVYNYKKYDLADMLADEYTTPENLYQGNMLEKRGVFK